MFPQRKLSIGEKSRSGRDPIIRALVRFNLDPTPWLKDGERALSRSRSPPDLNRGPPRFRDLPDSMLPPGVSVPPSTVTRPQYYPGYIPIPMPRGPLRCLIPRGLHLAQLLSRSAPLRRFTPPEALLLRVPGVSPHMLLLSSPEQLQSLLGPVGPPGFETLSDLSRRLASVEASRVAEAKRLADLEANRPRGRNSPLSVEGEAFCRSLAANALIQGGKPGLLSQMSQQLDVSLAPAEQQPFINLAILGSNAFRLRNMKLAFLDENLINKAYETCKNSGDLSPESFWRKVEQSIIPYY